MRKHLHQVLAIILVLLWSFSSSVIAEERWKELETYHSGMSYVQYFISKPFQIESKIWKIRYEAMISNPERRAYIQINCSREYGDRVYFETIMPRQDCVYYFYDEEIIYGYQRGYQDYKLVIISENMDWTVKIFELADSKIEPDTSQILDKIILIPRTEKDLNKEITQEYTFSPEDGILGVRLEKVLEEKKPTVPPKYFNYYFNISTNLYVDYPAGYQRGFIIHTEPNAKITLIITVVFHRMDCKLAYEIFSPETIER